MIVVDRFGHGFHRLGSYRRDRKLAQNVVFFERWIAGVKESLVMGDQCEPATGNSLPRRPRSALHFATLSLSTRRLGLQHRSR